MEPLRAISRTVQFPESNFDNFCFPAMVLADNGYDVWMGNFRGNRYGRKHLWIRLDAWDRLDERKFWQFS